MKEISHLPLLEVLKGEKKEYDFNIVVSPTDEFYKKYNTDFAAVSWLAFSELELNVGVMNVIDAVQKTKNYTHKGRTNKQFRKDVIGALVTSFMVANSGEVDMYIAREETRYSTPKEPTRCLDNILMKAPYLAAFFGECLDDGIRSYSMGATGVEFLFRGFGDISAFKPEVPTLIIIERRSELYKDDPEEVKFLTSGIENTFTLVI